MPFVRAPGPGGPLRRLLLAVGLVVSGQAYGLQPPRVPARDTSIDEAALVAVVMQLEHRTDFKGCVQRTRGARPAFRAGRLAIEVFIGANGRPRRVRSVNAPELEPIARCFAREVMSRWVFPRNGHRYDFAFTVIVQDVPAPDPPAPPPRIAPPRPDRQAPVRQALYQAMPRLQACLAGAAVSRVTMVLTSTPDGAVVGATTWPVVLARDGGGE
jgi:hypothetical protein